MKLLIWYAELATARKLLINEQLCLECKSYPQQFLSSSWTKLIQMHLSQTPTHTVEMGFSSHRRRKNWSLWLTHPFVKWTFHIIPSVRAGTQRHGEDSNSWRRAFHSIYQSGEAQTFSPAIHGYAVCRQWTLEKINLLGLFSIFKHPEALIYTGP